MACGAQPNQPMSDAALHELAQIQDVPHDEEKQNEAQPRQEEHSEAQSRQEEQVEAQPRQEKHSEAQSRQEEQSKAQLRQEVQVEAQPLQEEQNEAQPSQEEQIEAQPRQEEQSTAQSRQEVQVEAQPRQEEQSKAQPSQEEQVEAQPRQEEQIEAQPRQGEKVEAQPSLEEQVEAHPRIRHQWQVKVDKTLGKAVFIFVIEDMPRKENSQNQNPSGNQTSPTSHQPQEQYVGQPHNQRQLNLKDGHESSELSNMNNANTDRYTHNNTESLDLETLNTIIVPYIMQKVNEAQTQQEEQVEAQPRQEEQVEAQPRQEEQVEAQPRQEEKVEAQPRREEKVEAQPSLEEQVEAQPRIRHQWQVEVDTTLGRAVFIFAIEGMPRKENPQNQNPAGDQTSMTSHQPQEQYVGQPHNQQQLNLKDGHESSELSNMNNANTDRYTHNNTESLDLETLNTIIVPYIMQKVNEAQTRQEEHQQHPEVDETFARALSELIIHRMREMENSSAQDQTGNQKPPTSHEPQKQLISQPQQEQCHQQPHSKDGNESLEASNIDSGDTDPYRESESEPDDAVPHHLETLSRRHVEQRRKNESSRLKNSDGNQLSATSQNQRDQQEAQAQRVEHQQQINPTNITRAGRSPNPISHGSQSFHAFCANPSSHQQTSPNQIPRGSQPFHAFYANPSSHQQTSQIQISHGSQPIPAFYANPNSHPQISQTQISHGSQPFHVFYANPSSHQQTPNQISHGSQPIQVFHANPNSHPQTSQIQISPASQQIQQTVYVNATPFQTLNGYQALHLYHRQTMSFQSQHRHQPLTAVYVPPLAASQVPLFDPSVPPPGMYLRFF